MKSTPPSHLVAWLPLRRQLLHTFCGCCLWLLGGLLLPAGPASAQQRHRLHELDSLLQQPLRNQIITDSAYAAVLYQKQVLLTGLAVQQGKILGTNATFGDKTAALNIGLPNLNLFKLSYVALIANGRFTAEEGFTKLFTKENPRGTATYGATLMLFQPGRSSYGERTKKDLQWQLRELRRQEKVRWGGDSLQPYNSAAWQAKYLPIMANFIEKWGRFQTWLAVSSGKNKDVDRAHMFYNRNGAFSDKELDDSVGEHLYLNYLDAEHAALPLLTDKWDGWNQQQEQAYIYRQLGGATLQRIPSQDTLQQMLRAIPQFAAMLDSARLRASQRVLKARAQAYDSLQQQVSWARKWRGWATVQVLHSNDEQPIFNLANRAQTYADVYYNNYWQLQAAYNALVEGHRGNLAVSLGGGTSNGLVFRKADLRTYQTSAWQTTGTDSALVVTQKSLYASTPERRRYWNLQTQVTGTLSQLLPGFGLTTAYEVLLAPDTHAIHNITLGVIVPLRATPTSTVLFIPQARARGSEAPDRWSFGFTLTASLPTFLGTTFR
jgi:hypothetical protein